MSGKKARRARAALRAANFEGRIEPRDVPLLRDRFASDVAAQTSYLRRRIDEASRDLSLDAEARRVAASVRAGSMGRLIGTDAVPREIRRSELWYVSDDMLALALSAMDDQLPAVEVPAATAFFFESPLPISAIGGLSDAPGQQGVELEVRGGMLSGDGIEYPMAITACRHDGSCTYTLSAESESRGLTRLLRAIWLLREHPNVADVTSEIHRSAGQTAARRPLSAASASEVDTVRVVRAHENRGTAGNGHGSARAPYSHRFIVRGFWRNQPCGEGRADRKRIWVPPFIKGPADKPLVVKDTVNVLD
mgnify:FL=1